MFRIMPILALLAATSAPHPARADAAPPGHCVSREYRQFDFWVGSWDVYPTGRDQLVAHSLIESVYNGCGVRENWMPLKTENSGGSLNIYVPAEKLWRQTWIDSSGARVDFKGGWNGKVMILEGYWQDLSRARQRCAGPNDLRSGSRWIRPSARRSVGKQREELATQF
jgi:hypothetical protein